MYDELTYRMKNYREKMSDAEVKIADYFLEHGRNASQKSIQQIAKALDVSVATISRFSKKIGYENFLQMKIAATFLKNEAASENYFFEELRKEDTPLEIAQKSVDSKISSMQATTAMIDEETFSSCVETIRFAKSLNFFAFGASSGVAHIGEHKFLRTAIPTFFYSDFHMQIMHATRLGQKDCAILISHSGNNRDVLRIAEILIKNDVKTIAITSNPSSALSEICQNTLTCVSEETSYRPEAISSLVSQIAIVDALFLSIAVKYPDLSIMENIRLEIQKIRKGS